VRVLTVAVVDDLVALVVIATAYTDHVSLMPLLVAAALFAALVALRFAPDPWRLRAAVVVGVAVWVALLKSGIDPVIAGLGVGLITSAYRPSRGDLERVIESTRSFREQPTPELARSAQLALGSAISPNERLGYRLHPWTSFVIVPLFALANAGIHVNGSLLADAIASPVTLGIFFGYVLGKPLGITGAAWLGYRTARGRIRLALSWPVIASGGVVAGVGFTVSVLIASIAFTGRHLEEAKVGVLAAAVTASALSWVAFRIVASLPAPVRARQLRGTDEELVDLSDDVDPERDHVRGPDDAPVTLLEYGDYQCPYCGQAEVVIRELISSFGDDLRYVWRHLPLNDVHPDAQMAAEAAEAAAAQGRFWELHDLLLTHQDELGPTQLATLAEEAGLDVDRFWDELQRREYAERVAEDVATADASEVAGTPSFFINGRRYQGAYDIQTLTAVVAAAERRLRLTTA
jgi:protein-disulfide isomerase